MYTVHGRGANLPFSYVLAMVQYWYREICSIVRCNPMVYALALFNSNSSICGASHREAVSTIFKVFGMTWPWFGYEPRPPKV